MVEADCFLEKTGDMLAAQAKTATGSDEEPRSPLRLFFVAGNDPGSRHSRAALISGPSCDKTNEAACSSNTACDTGPD
ncbi:MAG: hypothetical protein WA796_23115 [Pseudolabrys sp.]